MRPTSKTAQSGLDASMISDDDKPRAGGVPGELGALVGSGALFQAKIISIDEHGLCLVAAAEERLTASRSLSCLLEPEVGDKVLLARMDGQVFILAILDRLLPDVMTLSVPHAKRVEIAAPEIAVRARDRLALHGRETDLEGERVRLLAKSFNLVGQVATFIAHIMRSTTNRHETVADQIMVQAGDRTTHVSGLDTSEISTLVQNVEQVSAQTAQTAIVSVQDDLRFDGKRVTIG